MGMNSGCEKIMFEYLLRIANFAAPKYFGVWRSPVSALRSGRRGREFESHHPDILIYNGLQFILQTVFFIVYDN